MMKIKAFCLAGILFWGVMTHAFADGLFFEDEKIQDGIPVFEMSENFADIYEKLDGVNWTGKNLRVAIESLERLNKNAHIALTDERVVLVWGDSIVANFPKPSEKDWASYGEITTALILKMRENDAMLRSLPVRDLYSVVVDALVGGLEHQGRYVHNDIKDDLADNRLLTSLGIQGARDERGNFRIAGVYKDSPADVAGVRLADIIVQINGTDVANLSDADLASVFSGFNSGTSKLKLLTPSGNRSVVIRRASVVMADADVVHRADDNNTGELLEIVVHNVSDNAVDIINRALAMYPSVSGIVLDLRATNGDDEKAAAKLAGLFIGQKPIMRIVETASDELEIVPGGDAVSDVPVVVLVSDMTRGTAEAIAAAFYENNRGVLVGTPTGGNAKIASKIPLKNGAILELLNKSVKTGSGKSIDGRGVFPIVCLSNIRSSQQQNAFFLNIINDNFNARDFNRETDVAPDVVRRGCPTITSGVDEDALATAVSVKILTDKKIYNKLLSE